MVLTSGPVKITLLNFISFLVKCATGIYNNIAKRKRRVRDGILRERKKNHSGFFKKNKLGIPRGDSPSPLRKGIYKKKFAFGDRKNHLHNREN